MHEHLLKRGMSVTLVAFTPDPDAVCDMAARTCTSAQCPELSPAVNRTRALEHARDAHHNSVLEHAVFTFLIEGVSRALTHQLVRHRIASYSQQSQRFVSMDTPSYVTPHTVNGSEEARRVFDETMDVIWEAYSELEALGIPPEDARYVLPNACKTNITVTMNARSLLNFFEERLCTHAQWEIRELAGMMLELAKRVAPVIFEDAGPKCVRFGYCPERHGCGRCPPKRDAE